VIGTERVADDREPVDATAERSSVGRRARDAAILVPGIVAVAVFVFWQANQGGYPPVVWYPGALLVLGALAVTATTCRPSLRDQPRRTVLAVAFLAGFTVWTFASIAWADVRGDAWDGANRTLLYLAAFALFALRPWRSQAAVALLGAYVLATAAVLTAFLLRAASASDPGAFFTSGRLAEPTGYANANAALALAAFWPALFLSSRREVAWPLRALMTGCAGVLLELGLLPQSRGSAFAFPIVAALYVALVPGRGRSLLFALPVGFVVAAFLDPLLDVYAVAESDPAFAAAVARAGRAMLYTFAILVPLGGCLALADRRLRLDERVSRLLSRVLAVLAAAACVAAAAFLLVVVGNPAGRAVDAWSDFKAGQPTTSGNVRLAGSLGSNRYDFWRVAVAEFRDSPITGIGADNFAVGYVRARGPTGEEPSYPHSLEVMILSQTGIVGSVLFVGFLVCALAAAWRARLLTDPLGRALAACSVVAFAYFFVHGSGDWLWEFPGLGAPAFAWLGLGVGLAQSEPSGSTGALETRAGRRLAALALLALTFAAASSFVLPWLAAREVDLAVRTWRDDPADAFVRLERARKLNVLSERPDLVAGAIAARTGDLERMRAAYERALERSPRNWYAHLELAILDANSGARDVALARLDEAQALNPLEPTIDEVRRLVAGGERVSLEVIRRTFVQRVQAITN
jgi:hypothetical protein